MAYITHEDSKEIKNGIVRIHKILEIRKLRNIRHRNNKYN